MPRRGTIPALDINGNGALLKIESRPLSFNIHYPAESKLNPGRCGCIFDLIKEECRGCRDLTNPRVSTSNRYACLVRDIRNNTWCILHATHQMLAELVSVGEKAKYQSKQIFEGNGPIFIVQRIGSTYGVTISSAPMPEEPFDPKPADSRIAESIAYRSYWSKSSPTDYLIPDRPPIRTYQPSTVETYDWESVARAEETRRELEVILAASSSRYVNPIDAEMDQGNISRIKKTVPKPKPKPPVNEEPINLDHLDADADLWDDL